MVTLPNKQAKLLHRYLKRVNQYLEKVQPTEFEHNAIIMLGGLVADAEYEEKNETTTQQMDSLDDSCGCTCFGCKAYCKSLESLEEGNREEQEENRRGEQAEDSEGSSG